MLQATTSATAVRVPDCAPCMQLLYIASRPATACCLTDAWWAGAMQLSTNSACHAAAFAADTCAVQALDTALQDAAAHCGACRYRAAAICPGFSCCCVRCAAAAAAHHSLCRSSHDLVRSSLASHARPDVTTAVAAIIIIKYIVLNPSS
jgi:hypothetical protein